MSETIDNAPKDGDFVRYVEQLEKEQMKSAAVMMERVQARSPGEVRPVAPAKTAAKAGGQAVAGPVKLTMAQAQKAAEILSQGNTSGAGSTDMNPLVQQFFTRFGTFIAIVVGVIVFAKFTDIPLWIAVPVVLGIWASYYKKSKNKE
ncbi:MAG: hypothetical protein ACRCV9_20215 [Burkholderiaceae bacterium]